ncbi:MAG: sugar ABC transporter permease [Actinomycetota bacterium]
MSLTSNAHLDFERPLTPMPPRRTRAAWRSRVSSWDVKFTPYLLIAPFFVIFTVFGLFPLLYNGVVSLRTWRLDDPSNDGWAGLANYRQLLHDGAFRHALINTFGIFLVSTIPQLLMALILASVLNRKLRLRTTLRVGVLLPYITPLAASTLVFAAIFARDSGVMNYILSLVHVHAIDWQEDKYWSWLAIAIMVNWRWVGYNALIYLGAMQSVPRDLYEASALDGAKPWQQLWKITVPMIRPTLIFTIVLSTIGGMQLFTEPLLFNQKTADATGGTAGQFNTVALMIYKTGWKDLNLGYAAAIAWALFVIILVLAGLNAFVANRRVAGGK